MRRALLGSVVALLSVVAFSTTALASASDPATGYLEVCKSADTTGPVTGPFTFRVTEDGAVVATQTVTTGTCSAPFTVPSGTATVTEASVPYATVTDISATPASNLVSSDLATGAAVVNVAAGDISTTTTLKFTNKEVTGYVEVCKKAATGSGLTGSFQFTITGAMGFSQNVSVPVGACSNSIQVPAGPVTIKETSPATYVTAIDVQPAANEISSSLSDATTRINVAGGDVSTETIATFTDAASVLKICKVAGDSSLLGQNFPFTANGSSLTVPAGSPPGGTCELVPGVYTAGTTVDIAEGIVPGTEVSDITVGPSSREVSGSLSLTNRTVSVVLGSGETVVTYTNVPAPPGTLKICKVAGAGVAPGSMWTFTVSGMTGSVTVPAGSCTIAGQFAFNSTHTITETATPGFAVTAITANPASRLVGTPNLATGTASVMIGTGVTEALYTNAAAAPTTGTSGTGPSGTGTSGSTGTSGTGTSGSTGTSGTTGSHPAAHHKQAARLRFARLIKRHGRYYVVCSISSSAKHARVRLTELDKKHKMLRRAMMTVRTGRTVTLRLPGNSSKVRSIKLEVLS